MFIESLSVTDIFGWKHFSVSELTFTAADLDASVVFGSVTGAKVVDSQRTDSDHCFPV